jgi:hypothetical protein
MPSTTFRMARVIWRRCSAEFTPRSCCNRLGSRSSSGKSRTVTAFSANGLLYCGKPRPYASHWSKVPCGTSTHINMCYVLCAVVHSTSKTLKLRLDCSVLVGVCRGKCQLAAVRFGGTQLGCTAHL